MIRYIVIFIMTFLACLVIENRIVAPRIGGKLALQYGLTVLLIIVTIICCRGCLFAYYGIDAVITP